MEKTIRRFRDISATLAELNAAGLHSQTVNDLLTMCVGTASQHVLRMSLCLRMKPRRATLRSLGFWSQLTQRDATSSLFHRPLKLEDLGVLKNATQPLPAVLGRQSFPPS